MQIHSFVIEYEMARRLAIEAGRTILRYRREHPPEPPTEDAVREASATIVGGVRNTFPSDAILTATTADHDDRLRKDRVWIVDPLEAECDGHHFAVSIGLTIAAMPVVGVIYSPTRDVLYGAAWGAGAWTEETGATRPLRARPPPSEGLRLMTPAASEPILSSILADLDARDVQRSASASVSCTMIATGLADLYIHPTPWLNDWQCCVPDLVLREAGGTVTDCYGEPLTYNHKIPVQRQGVIGCTPGLLDLVLPSVTPRFASVHGPGHRTPETGGLPLRLVDARTSPVSTTRRST